MSTFTHFLWEIFVHLGWGHHSTGVNGDNEDWGLSMEDIIVDKITRPYRGLFPSLKNQGIQDMAQSYLECCNV